MGGYPAPSLWSSKLENMKGKETITEVILSPIVE